MKILDPLGPMVTHRLPRLSAPVPVQTHPVRSILKQHSGVGRGPRRLVESAFPMLAIPGFWEMLRKFQSEQGQREPSNGVDLEDFNRFSQRSTGWNYTIVPWED
jgi:hypothetical protein